MRTYICVLKDVSCFEGNIRMMSLVHNVVELGTFLKNMESNVEVPHMIYLIGMYMEFPYLWLAYTLDIVILYLLHNYGPSQWLITWIKCFCLCVHMNSIFSQTCSMQKDLLEMMLDMNFWTLTSVLVSIPKVWCVDEYVNLYIFWFRSFDKVTCFKY